MISEIRSVVSKNSGPSGAIKSNKDVTDNPNKRKLSKREKVFLTQELTRQKLT